MESVVEVREATGEDLPQVLQLYAQRAIDDGARFIQDFGISIEQVEELRRPVCRLCLDWSEQTHHLGGALGHALLERMLALKWLKKDPRTRAVTFTKNGTQAFSRLIARPAL